MVFNHRCVSPRALKAYGLTQNRSRTNILHEPIITSLLEPTRGSFRMFALFFRKISFVFVMRFV